MADNDTAKNASGSTVTYASDDIAGVKVPRVKVQWGVDGSVVDASATNPFPVDLVSPGTGATSLGKAEDAAHTSGNVGVMALGVRQDTGGTPMAGTDGDYIPLSVDANGYLRVNVTAGAASGVEYTEGDTDASITGKAILWEDASNTLRPVSAVYPLPTDAVTPTEVFNTTAFLTRRDAGIQRIAITTTATPDYSVSDGVGGEISLTNAVNGTSYGSVLNSITLWCDDALSPELLIAFFDADLSGGTYTDNGAITLSAADKANILAIKKIATTDWVTFAGDTYATVGDLGIVLQADGTQDLRMLIQTNTTMNLSGTAVMSVIPGYLR